MAETTITELPAASTLTGTEVLPADQSGGGGLLTAKVTSAQLAVLAKTPAQSSLSGAGTTQGTAAAIGTGTQILATPTANQTGFILPTTTEQPAYADIQFYNVGTVSGVIYPPTGGSINGQTVNLGVGVQAGQAVTIQRTSALNWRAAEGPAPTALVVSTVASLQATVVPSAVVRITLLGYYSVNDGGGSTLTLSEAVSGQFQSADGAWWAVQYNNGFNAAAFGARAASADNGPFINSAINALPNGRGYVYLPSGTIAYTTPISMSGKTDVKLVGQGGLSAGAATGTLLYFTGTGAGYGIDMTGAIGCWISQIFVIYSSASFTGTLIYAGYPSGGQSAHCGMEHVTFGGTPHTTDCFIDLNNAQDFTLRNFSCFGASGRGAVVGPVSGQYGSVIKLVDGEFTSCVVAPLANAGDSFNCDNVIFERLIDGTAGAYRETGSYVTPRALSFTNGCWFGDVTVSGGTWISTAATSFTLRDSVMGGNSATPGTTIGVALSAAKGADIRGNTFTFVGTVVSLGGACTNISYGGNEESSCGTIIANPANGFVAPTAAITGSNSPSSATYGTDTTPSVTETYICQIQVSTPASATGVALLNGSAVAGNIQLFLANSTGTVVLSTASTAASGTAAYQRVPFSAVTYLPSGTYYVCLQCNNTGMRFRTQPFGNFGASKKTSTVYGTLVSITAPTTFTADLGPIAGLY